MKKEVLSVTLSYGASSLFWLLSALRLNASVFGQMMQIQALLLILNALFALRTYDLVFHLQKTYSLPARRAFYTALRLEVALAFLSSAITLAGSQWILPKFQESGSAHVAHVWPLIIVLVNLTILQGASAGYLRIRDLDSRVANADLLTAVAWLASLSWLLLTDMPTIVHVLTAGFACAAVRPLVMTIFALLAARSDATPTAQEALPLDKVSIIRILLSGQLTNLLKNNLLSLETVLLGRVVSAESVAVFRIARALLNLSTVLLNISYQKTFRELSRCATLLDRSAVVKRMNIVSIKLWCATLPAVFIAGMIYRSVQTTGAYEDLILILALATLASFPVVLQQSDFASLSLDNRFLPINIAYLCGFVVLLLGCVFWADYMSLVNFMILSACAAVVRYLLLHGAARKAIQ
jgi:hypothetical protein